MEKIKIVCISDTHLQVTDSFYLPEADILIHTGDFCSSGKLEDFIKYCSWLEKFKYKYSKILQIAGNHDWIAEKNESLLRDEFFSRFGEKLVYLKDEAFRFKGINFYGTPMQPIFQNWAFNRSEKELENYFSKIPESTDILLTHCPPYEILDKVFYRGINVGSISLLNKVKEVKPKVHIFGHIHECYGSVKREGTLFINASICDLEYQANNKPIMLEYGKSISILNIRKRKDCF